MKINKKAQKDESKTLRKELEVSLNNHFLTVVNDLTKSKNKFRDIVAKASKLVAKKVAKSLIEKKKESKKNQSIQIPKVTKPTAKPISKKVVSVPKTSATTSPVKTPVKSTLNKQKTIKIIDKKKVPIKK